MSGRDPTKMHIVSAKISTVASQLEMHAQEPQQRDSSSVLKSNFLYTVVLNYYILYLWLILAALSHAHQSGAHSHASTPS